LNWGQKKKFGGLGNFLPAEYPEIFGTKAINLPFLRNFGGVAMAI
jgi:hypothetical protein